MRKNGEVLGGSFMVGVKWAVRTRFRVDFFYFLFTKFAHRTPAKLIHLDGAQLGALFLARNQISHKHL